MKKEHIIGLVVLVVFVGIIAYFLISSKTSKPGEIPSYVTGEMRAMYEYAKTPQGAALLAIAAANLRVIYTHATVFGGMTEHLTSME